MKSLILIALAFGLAGCSAEPPHSYHFSVTASCPSYIAEAAAEAAIMWEQASGNILSVEVDMGGEGTPIRCHEEDRADHRMGAIGDDGGIDLHMHAGGLEESALDTTLLEIVAHEMGHVLGLDHTSGPAVMGAELASGSYCLTEGDVAELCRVYDCSGHATASTCEAD
jgi:hypothetical protein